MRDFGTGSTVMGIVENVLKVALVAVTWKCAAKKMCNGSGAVHLWDVH